VVDDQNLTDNVTQSVGAYNNLASASFQMDANVKLVNNPVTFTSTSSDSDGNILIVKWYYGDGAIGYGNSTQHSYSRSDVYTVTMEVTDDDGGVNTSSDVVYIAGALVDDSYPGDTPEENKWDSIQDGINDIKENELLYVFNGCYNGGITMNKTSISIYGEEDENILIDGSGGTAVNIVNNSSMVDGFIIENASIGVRVNSLDNNFISNCNILNSTMGIKIENGADENIIVNCNFTNNSYGVYISGSDYNIVGSISDIDKPVLDNNVFLLNDYGVYLENADNNCISGCTINGTGYSDPGGPGPITWGVCLDNSDNNTIMFCDIFNATNYAIYMGGSMDNLISNCIIKENSKGVYLSGSSYNSIIGNNLSDNTYAGVSILTVSCNSNSILFNDFIRNGVARRIQAEDFGTGTNWNTSNGVTYLYNASGEGNYWYDYRGTDSDGDGIGDTPYIIPGTANARDSYPVIVEYGWLYQWF
jgi:parallel beta-helix repeat protein